MLYDPSTADQQFRAWLRTHQPDSLISFSSEPCHWSVTLARIPPVTVLNLLPGEPWEGIVQSYPVMAQFALDRLLTALERGERGLPENPVSQLVPGIWQSCSARAMP